MTIHLCHSECIEYSWRRLQKLRLYLGFKEFQTSQRGQDNTRVCFTFWTQGTGARKSLPCLQEWNRPLVQARRGWNTRPSQALSCRASISLQLKLVPLLQHLETLQQPAIYSWITTSRPWELQSMTAECFLSQHTCMICLWLMWASKGKRNQNAGTGRYGKKSVRSLHFHKIIYNLIMHQIRPESSDKEFFKLHE